MIMESSYNFPTEDIPSITLQLLVDSFAFQQAATAIIIEHLNLPELEKDEITKEISKEKMVIKEQILQSLYGSFGSTPNV